MHQLWGGAKERRGNESPGETQNQATKQVEKRELSEAIGSYPTGYRVAKAEGSPQIVEDRQAGCANVLPCILLVTPSKIAPSIFYEAC